MATPVTVDNFARAESDRMFTAIQAQAGGVNALLHYRAPTPVDQQTVIRMNRDTLYSVAVVDISAGATITLPDSGDRYLSAMVVNRDHYINGIFHEPGEHALTVDMFETPWVLVGLRVFLDPEDADDVAVVNALQDQIALDVKSSQPFETPEYDAASLDATRNSLLELGRGLPDSARAFGGRDEVEPIRHLIFTAGGWGGLPEREAYYLNVEPGLSVGQYQLTMKDVPVDGFWSISLYNAEGYFEPNERNAYSVNNVSAKANDDGSVTVHFGGADDRPNLLPIMDGWNYIVRLYRPRPEVLDGSWTLPPPEPV